MIVCRQCGQRNGAGNEFCEACGAFLEWEGERVDAGSSDPPPPPPAGVPPPPPPPQEAPPPPPAPPDPVPPGPAPAKASGNKGKSTAGKVRCLECGAYNTPDRRFCNRCGASIDLVLLGGASAGAGAVADEVRTDHAPAPSAAAPAPPATGQPPVPPTPSIPAPSTGRPPTPPPAPTPPAVGRAPSPAAPVPTKGQPPAGERVEGMQPAMAKERPPPERPAPTEAPVAPGGPLCPQCGTANEPGRRFCRRCGAALAGAATAGGPRVMAPSMSWWQRLLAKFRRKPPDGTDPDRFRTAKSAFRSSLSLRYRVMRVFGVLAFLGLGVGFLGVSRINPISGARDLWRDVFPRYDRLTEVQAASAPADLDRREFEANDAVDGAPNTAWGSAWRLAADDEAVPGCQGDEPTTGGAETSLELTPSETTDLAKLEIQPGLPQGDAARENQWQPTRIELRYTHDSDDSDGDERECDVIALDGDPGMQSHEIEVSNVSSVRITVLDADAPTSGSGELVTIGEVRLFSPG